MLAGEKSSTPYLDLLRELAERPAVSFQEGPVATRIQNSLEGMGLAVAHDRYGNLIVRHSGQSRNREDHPPIAFVAHMDHPGFEVVEDRGETVIARALGGVPQACFSGAVAVQIILPDGTRLSAETAGTYGGEGERMVSLRLNASTLRSPEKSRPLELPSAAVLDVPDFQLDGELIHMRAADDLAGCAAILAALKVLVSDEEVGEVYGVFTRAEEVGLIGARLLAEEGILPADTLVVSLEASKSLPGAAIGGGPVIRVGDASFTFDAEAEGVLLKARDELAERDPDPPAHSAQAFSTQRQLMSGGTCEASAFRYHGYRTTGIAFPLGNYHNATPDGEVGAEYIHIDDFLGGVDLIVQAARCVARRREAGPWRRMREVPEEYRTRLAETAPAPKSDS